MIALVAALAVTFVSISVAPHAAAATATISVTRNFDGTGFSPGGAPTSNSCPITGAGGDNSPTDGVVCTNDQLSFNWNYSIPADVRPTVVQFSSTLPAGATWDNSNVTLCQGGGSTGYTGTGSITNSGRTLSCQITWAAGAARSGSIPVIVNVSAQVANGTVLAPSVAVTQNGTTTTVSSPGDTVRALPRFDLHKSITGLPVLPNGDFQESIGVWATSEFPNVASGNLKGIPDVPSFSFTDDLTNMPAGTTLTTPGNCQLSRSPATAPGTSGSWTCTQTAPGQPVTIAVTGADTSAVGSDIQPGEGPLVFSGSFVLTIPAASRPVTTTTYTDQLGAFDPTDVAGQSNYAAGFEPGGAPGNTCSSPAGNNNCASVTMIGTGGGGGGFKLGKTIENTPIVRNANNDWLVGPGDPFSVRLDMLNQDGVANTVSCDFFDPAKQQIDPSIAPSSYYYNNNTPLTFTVQYTDRTFTSDAQRAAATCGVAGDNSQQGPWYDSVGAVPGGVASITGYRFVYPNPQAIAIIISHQPFVDVAMTQGTVSQDYADVIEPGTATDTATDHYVVTSFLSATKIAYDSTGTAITSGLAGQDVRFDITPKVLPATTLPAVLTVTDTLAPCELAPTLTTTSTWTMTVAQPADTGPDGLPCTADDVSGTVLTFTSNAPVAPGSEPVLTYHVQLASGANDGTLALNSAVLNEQGNAQDAGMRTVNRALTIRSASQVSMTKTPDTTQIQQGGQPAGWTLEWANTASTSVGKTQWIDVLPFNGDGRGTSMHGTLQLSSLSVQGSPTNDVTYELTAAPPAGISDDPSDPSNGPGGSTTWCTTAQLGAPGCPASLGQVTAFRVTVGNLTAGRVGGLHVVEQPTGNQSADVYVNSVGPGQAAGLAQPVPTATAQPIVVTGSTISGLVWQDQNRNGVQDSVTGEPGLNAIVDLYQGSTKIASTTSSGGAYSFSGLVAGTYRVVVEPGSMTGSPVPTYDLDNGTTNPDGDSGPVTLGASTNQPGVNFGYAFVVAVSTSVSTGPGATAGDSAFDNVTFSGFTAVEQGSYTPVVLGPVAPVSGSCAGVVWSSAPSTTLPSFAVGADGTKQTATTALSSVGCYTFAGTYFGNAGAQDTTTVPAGLAAETVLVGPHAGAVTTSVSASTAHSGDAVHDTFFPTMGPGSTTITWTLVGPVAPVNNSCAGVNWSAAAAVGSGSVTVDQSTVSIDSASTTVYDQGCYSYVSTLQPNASTSGATSPAGSANETILVTTVPAQVSTTSSALSGAPGTSVSDTVQLAGTFGASGTFSWTLLGPVPAINASCAAVNWTNAPTVFTGTTPFTGDGSYQSGSRALNVSGCYTWVENVPATSRSAQTTTAPGNPNETVLISTNAPTLTTTFTPATALPGDAVHDHVVVTGLGVSSTTLDWTLYGPVPPVNGSCVGVNWSGAPTVASGSMPIPNDATYDTPPTSVAVAGCYSYADTLEASPSNAAATVPAGNVAETALVNPFVPGVATQISATTVPVAAQVHDTVTLSNMHGAATTLSWTLLGPVAPVAGSCAQVSWAGAPVEANGTMPVTGDGTYVTPDVGIPVAACFTYVDTLGQTPTTAALTTTPGDPTETVHSTQTPGALATTVSTSSAHPGDNVTDSVNVTMGAGTAQLDWSLVGPVAPVNGLCAGADFSSAATVAGASVTVSNGVWVTPATTLLDQGCYSFTETLHPTASTNGASSAAGSANETVLVTTQPVQISTSASANTARPGDAISDEIALAGTFGASGSISWALAGPVAPLAGGTDCSGVTWAGAPVAGSGTLAFTGDGTYTTATTTVSAAGCYSYTEDVAATSRSAATATTPGAPAETAYVAPNVPTVTTTFTGSGPAVPGQDVHDEVVVTGLGAASTTLDWSLLGPVAASNGSCAGVDWSAAATLRSGTVAIAGDGTYATASVAVPVAGCFTFADTLVSTSSSVTVAVPPGTVAETSRIVAFDPSISTVVSAATVTTGEPVHDSVQLDNLHAATTTMSWTLTGPVAPVAGSCANVNWAGAGKISGTASVHGDGSYTTPDIRLTLAGCYTYAEALDATSTTTAASSPAGLRSETVLAHVPTGGPGGGGLAQTGARLVGPVWLGILGLVIGVGLVVLGARRRADERP